MSDISHTLGTIGNKSYEIRDDGMGKLLVEIEEKKQGGMSVASERPIGLHSPEARALLKQLHIDPASIERCNSEYLAQAVRKFGDAERYLKGQKTFTPDDREYVIDPMLDEAKGLREFACGEGVPPSSEFSAGVATINQQVSERLSPANPDVRIATVVKDE